jgi:hypothetical protein
MSQPESFFRKIDNRIGATNRRPGVYCRDGKGYDQEKTSVDAGVCLKADFQPSRGFSGEADEVSAGRSQS